MSMNGYLNLLPVHFRKPIKWLLTKGLTLTADITGDVTGNVTGNVTGDLTGDVDRVLTTYAADTDLSDADFTTTFVELDGSSVSCAITNWTPTVGKMYVITCSDSSNATTIALSSGVTWDGSNDTATFDAAGETLTVIAYSASRLMVIANPDSVAFSGA